MRVCSSIIPCRFRLTLDPKEIMRLALSQQTNDRAIVCNPVPQDRKSDPAHDPILWRMADCACGGRCSSCKGAAGDLRVSAPNDPAEIEADRMADSVIRGPRGNAGGHATQTAAGPAIHAKDDTAVSGATGLHADVGRRISSSRGNGKPLTSLLLRSSLRKYPPSFDLQ